MQRLDEKKRQQITQAAVRLFASKPFHQVKLDEVAAAARVGKGTVYLYFKNKEEMYLSLVLGPFSELVDRLTPLLADESRINPWQALKLIVAELAEFAVAHPNVYEITRAVPLSRLPVGKRRELAALIERAIRRGIRAGVMCDPNPELTATFIPAMVRSAMLFGPKELTARRLAEQIIGLLRAGVGKGERRCR
jgi:AcrR family transcriptional regulator